MKKNNTGYNLNSCGAETHGKTTNPAPSPELACLDARLCALLGFAPLAKRATMFVRLSFNKISAPRKNSKANTTGRGNSGRGRDPKKTASLRHHVIPAGANFDPRARAAYAPGQHQQQPVQHQQINDQQVPPEAVPQDRPRRREKPPLQKAHLSTPSLFLLCSRVARVRDGVLMVRPCGWLREIVGRGRRQATATPPLTLAKTVRSFPVRIADEEELLYSCTGNARRLAVPATRATATAC